MQVIPGMATFRADIAAMLNESVGHELWCALVRAIAGATVNAQDQSEDSSPLERDDDFDDEVSSLIREWRDDSLPLSDVDMILDNRVYWRENLDLSWDEIFNFGPGDACGINAAEVVWDLHNLLEGHVDAQEAIDEDAVELHFFEWRARFMRCVFDAAIKLIERESREIFARSTRYGFENRNGQINIGELGLPGTDHNQKLYRMLCGHCDFEYAANGTDIFQRKCPKCQGGAQSSGGWTST